MKIGVIHYNFPQYSLENFLDYAVDTGYGYVELQIRDVWESQAVNPEKKAEEVKRELESRGLSVSALSASNDFVQLAEKEIEFQVNRMKRICGLAVILGTNVLRTEGGQPKESVPDERWVDAMVDCFKRCVDFIEKVGILLAVDNHGYVTNDADRQIEIFDRVGSKNIGANLDTMNYRWFGHDPQTVGKFCEMIAPWVFHVHMKDGSGSLGDYQGAALGEGEIDLTKAVRCLKDAGYDGVWCAEYEGGENPQAGYRRCFEYLKGKIHK